MTLKIKPIPSRHSEQNVAEFYNDNHEVRRISALCKDFLGICKPFAQNDVAGLAACTSYGAMSADNCKHVITLVKGTSYGAMSADNRKHVITLVKSTSYGSVSIHNRKCAFTLAEVLITLAIIGVVAAMTLPAVVNKYQEKVTVTKVKKFYSVMNQALLMAIKDNGYVDEWSFMGNDSETGEPVSDKLATYIKPYLKISKDCGTDTTCISSVNYKLFNNSGWGSYGARKWYYKMILTDGSHLWIRTNAGAGDGCSAGMDATYSQYSNVCGVLWFDVNGKQPPNAIGKDTFVFFILKDRIVPSRNDDCNLNGAGWGCSGYILSNGDMKYLYK